MNIEAVNRASDAYLKDTGTAVGARLNFLKGLWQIQSELEEGASPYTAPGAADSTDALATGQPLFLLSTPQIKTDALAAAVRRIADYVADNAGLEDDEVKALRDADFDSALTEDAVTHALSDIDGFIDTVAETLGVDAESPLSDVTLTFVLSSAITPFVTGAARSALDTLGTFQWTIWGSGDCPVCGSAAALGRVTEGSAQQGAERRLWCSACHAEWGYERIRCTRCGNRVQDELRYTYEESDPAHRLHVCDKCHGYIKFTIEGETDKPLVMVVEEAVSLELDAIARANGYTPTGDEPMAD
ncbi:MAG: formate dehydrogenase accessory protein FdhE [Coriobacteriia bacterium]